MGPSFCPRGGLGCRHGILKWWLFGIVAFVDHLQHSRTLILCRYLWLPCRTEMQMLMIPWIYFEWILPYLDTVASAAYCDTSCLQGTNGPNLCPV